MADGMGLTARQKQALDAITQHVAAHGVMPSLSSLAAAVGVNKTSAARLVAGLVTRDAISVDAETGAIFGFGRGGRGSIAVTVPPHLAAQLASFSIAQGDSVLSIATDAVALHLDQFEKAERETCHPSTNTP